VVAIGVGVQEGAALAGHAGQVAGRGLADDAHQGLVDEGLVQAPFAHQVLLQVVQLGPLDAPVDRRHADGQRRDEVEDGQAQLVQRRVQVARDLDDPLARRLPSRR
jgi:hypothetical protein